jgi:hypothetical protein
MIPETVSIPLPGLAGKPLRREGGELAPTQVEWGRRLAGLELEEMIEKIQRRAERQSLNRGLAISLPYFDDRAGEIRWREVQIIPRGRFPFVPAFVVLAARAESERVARDPALTPTTQAHLLDLLRALEAAFAPAAEGP